MNVFLTATLAALLMSSVGISIAHADNQSQPSEKSADAKDKRQEDSKSIADKLSIGFESPGIATTTAGGKFKYYGAENFSKLTAGQQSFDTNYGLPGVVTGAYTDLGIKYASSIDGGAYTKLTEDELRKDPNALGKTPALYAYAAAGSSIDLKLGAKDGPGIDYLGFYMPVADETGLVTFYRKGVKVASLSSETMQKGFDGAEGKDAKGVFINIFDTSGNFDEVRFSDSGKGQGFFTGDHTVGWFDNGVDGSGESSGGTGAVPEPATWTMMIVGVGLIGGALRRRRAGVTATAAA